MRPALMQMLAAQSVPLIEQVVAPGKMDKTVWIVEQPGGRREVPAEGSGCLFSALGWFFMTACNNAGSRFVNAIIQSPFCISQQVRDNKGGAERDNHANGVIEQRACLHNRHSRDAGQTHCGHIDMHRHHPCATDSPADKRGDKRFYKAQVDTENRRFRNPQQRRERRRQRDRFNLRVFGFKPDRQTRAALRDVRHCPDRQQEVYTD